MESLIKSERPSVGHFARLECGSVGTTSLDLSPLQTNLKKRPWREKMCIWNELVLVGEFFHCNLFVVNRILVLIMIVTFLFNCIIINLTKCFQQAAQFQLGPQLER